MPLLRPLVAACLFAALLSAGAACEQSDDAVTTPVVTPPVPVPGDVAGGASTTPSAQTQSLAETLEIRQEPLTVGVELDPSLREKLQSLLADPAQELTLHLTLPNVEPPETENVALRVFLNAPQATAATRVEHPAYVGSVSFFPHGGGAYGGAPRAASYSMNLAPALRRLKGLDELQWVRPLQVTLVPVPVRGDQLPQGATVRLSRPVVSLVE